MPAPPTLEHYVHNNIMETTMSKGNINVDIVPLLNWMTANNVFKKEDGKKPQQTERKEKPKSFEDMWMEEKKRRDAFDAFAKMQDKLNKKEDDKPKGLLSRVDHIALFLLGMMPINWLVAYMLIR